LLAAHQWVEAEKMYRQNPAAVSRIAGSFVGTFKKPDRNEPGAEALDILRHFPPSRQYPQAQTILPLAEAQAASQRRALPRRE
jgi:hypothetical protein